MKFEKKLASAFSLSSDGIIRWGEESDGEESDGDKRHEDRFSGKTIGEIFSMNHANLTSVIMTLMMERKMSVYAQRLFLDDAYLTTGKYPGDGNGFELVTIGWAELVAVGKVEQALIAGLQIIYHYAKNKRLNSKHKADDATVSLYHNKRDGFTRFDATYELNGHTSKLAVVEEGGESYMSLYVED